MFEQLGGDIGVAGRPSIGAMSADGTRIVVATRNAAPVRVLDWDGAAWVPVGAPLAVAGTDVVAWSVAIAADGGTIALGLPERGVPDEQGIVRVFGWDGSAWAQVGSDLVAVTDRDQFGQAVALSADGGRLAIGDPVEQAVTVLDLAGGTWVPVGTPIEPMPGGSTDTGQFGTSLAMSDDGTLVAVGDPFRSDINTGDGYVGVHRWESDAWQQLGGDIEREFDDDFFGEAVAFSADGGRLAVGAPATEGSTFNSVRVLDWDGTSWTQVGDDIPGDIQHEFFGWSVALSADGSRLAVKVPGNEALEGRPGSVRVFDWDGAGWVLAVPPLDVVGGAAFSGWVDISADGTRIADGDESVVRVFEQTEVVTTTTTVTTTTIATTTGPSTTPAPSTVPLPATGSDLTALMLATLVVVLGIVAVAIARLPAGRSRES